MTYCHGGLHRRPGPPMDRTWMTARWVIIAGIGVVAATLFAFGAMSLAPEPVVDSGVPVTVTTARVP
jgi:hypothetical protein